MGVGLGLTRLRIPCIANLNRILYPLKPFPAWKSARITGHWCLQGTYALEDVRRHRPPLKSTIEKLGYRHYDRLEAQRRA